MAVLKLRFGLKWHFSEFNTFFSHEYQYKAGIWSEMNVTYFAFKK